MSGNFSTEKIGKKTGNMGYFGKGIYFARRAFTALGYNKNADGNKSRKLLCCLVVLRDTYLIGKDVRSEAIEGSTNPYHGKPVKDGYDSHLSPQGKEIVVFDVQQILPCFCLALSHVNYFQSGQQTGHGIHPKLMLRSRNDNGTLIQLTPQGSKYEDIRNNFEMKWVGEKKPTIKEIWVVRDELGLGLKHQEYCRTIGNMRVRGHGRNPGNQQRRFHQCVMKCDFKGMPCSDKTCAVCSIIETGFQMKYVGSTAGSRFGAGIYCTSTPSKAYGYGNKKAMFVVNVACGVAQLSMGSCPLPDGFHSRIANTSNADECIVFNDNAMVALYLIVFE